MASALHHGPPGSYKTFTLTQRRAIDGLLEGRTIVTNIRGFDSIQRVFDSFPDYEFPDSAKIIYLNTELLENRQKMAVWYLWCPIGSLILIDEVQRIYRAKDKIELLTAVNYPQYYDEAVKDGKKRPDNFYDAFDMQRHFNFDIYMSSTNIAKVRSEIREVCDWAYRHRDISGLLPWKKNCWYEHQHDPEQSGKIASHRVGVPIEYKADPRIFTCYESTATGDHLTSKAGRSIFSDPKIVFTFVIAGIFLLYSVSVFVYKYNKKSSSSHSQESSKVSLDSSSQNSSKAVLNDINHGNVQPISKVNVVSDSLGLLELMNNKKIYIVSHYTFHDNFYNLRIVNEDGTYYYESSKFLLKLGFTIIPYSDCMFLYGYYEHLKPVYCGVKSESNTSQGSFK